MPLFSKKHKDMFIGGLITAFLSALGLWINNYFDSINEKQKIENKDNPQSTVLNNKLSDSSKQTITLNQNTQTNTGIVDVRNEYISGDKKVYKYDIFRAKKTKSPNIYNQDNNSGIIANDNSKVEVRVGKIQRKLDRELKSQALSLVKELFIKNELDSDTQIFVFAAANDQETINYANEINHFLSINGFNVTREIAFSLNFNSSDGQVYMFFVKESKQIHIFVYGQ